MRNRSTKQTKPFKDAAYEVLKEVGKPLHYNEITDLAFEKKILYTSGQTPHATMGSLLYTDTLNDNSRFQRAGKGKFALKSSLITGIEHQIKSTEQSTRQEVLGRLRQMHPQKFEELIGALLEVMGFEETEITAYTHDGGIDVRGILKTNQLTPVKVAIQAKRWRGNVGSREVQRLRGSLNSGEQGIMITSKDFTSDAKKEAQVEKRIPITLINGDRLVSLLFDYRLGIKEEQHTIRSIDVEYWRDALGVNFDEPLQRRKSTAKKTRIDFPVAIQASHGDKIYTGRLLDIKGTVEYDGKEYPKPTTAAKVIVTDWKEVNGWDFWRYLHPSSGNWEKIGKLR